jgi:hypothetical protein
MAIPGMVLDDRPICFSHKQISLGGGLPNPSLFPVKSLEFTVDDTKVSLTEKELATALQYSGSVS